MVGATLGKALAGAIGRGSSGAIDGHWDKMMALERIYVHGRQRKNKSDQINPPRNALGWFPKGEAAAAIESQKAYSSLLATSSIFKF